MSSPSLIVTARYRVRPDRRVDFLEAAHRLAEETRRAGGCAEFRVLFDAGDPEYFMLFQSWCGVEPMLQHFQTDPMTQFQETVRRLRVEEPTVKRYRVAA